MDVVKSQEVFMYKSVPTTQARLFSAALDTVGVENILEYDDGHKRVDIFIPKGKIYIEVDGPNHYTDHIQMADDFQRDAYSTEDGFHTIHIPNRVVEEDAMKIARAFKKMLNF